VNGIDHLDQILWSVDKEFDLQLQEKFAGTVYSSINSENWQTSESNATQCNENDLGRHGVIGTMAVCVSSPFQHGSDVIVRFSHVPSQFPSSLNEQIPKIRINKQV
jgi:hypothetical protein